ncbi:MAG: hypothetical protein KJI71_05210 [Patescibacteria group bacterium]|nr:hypothetical protein [Patescibacteria group bacterium]
MRDPKRIKNICHLLEKAWDYFPQQRLGQFLLNTVFGCLGRDSHIYHKEDNEVETILKLIIEKLEAFIELPEAEGIEETELFLKRIYRQSQKYIDKFKDDLNV